MDNDKPLIGEYKRDFKVKECEPVFRKFISRRDFINQTGLYISPFDFAAYHEEFKKSGKTVKQFVEDYFYKEFPFWTEIQVHGTIRVPMMVGDDIYKNLGDEDMTAIEVINALDMYAYRCNMKK